MHELVLVLFLLMQGGEGEDAIVQAVPYNVDGAVVKYESHESCVEAGEAALSRNGSVLGYICKVKPTRRGLLFING